MSKKYKAEDSLPEEPSFVSIEAMRKRFKSAKRNDEVLVIKLEDIPSILGTMDKQRPILWQQVNRLVRDFVNGEWDEEMPVMICFSKKGSMVDGQHRLLAQYIAKVGLVTYKVAMGLKPATIQRLDRGKERSVQERLVAFDENEVVVRITKGISSRKKALGGAVNFLYNVFTQEKDICPGDDIKIAEKFEAALTWAIETCYARAPLRRGALIAAFTALHYRVVTVGESPDLIDAFEVKLENILKSKNIDGMELRFHDYLNDIRSLNKKSAKVNDSQWTIFYKTLFCLRSIVDEEGRKNLPNLSKNLRKEQNRDWFFGDFDAVVQSLDLKTFQIMRETHDLASTRRAKAMISRLNSQIYDNSDHTLRRAS